MNRDELLTVMLDFERFGDWRAVEAALDEYTREVREQASVRVSSAPTDVPYVDSQAEYERVRAEVESDVREQVAREIEAAYLGADSGRLPDGRGAPDANERHAYDEGLEQAARIARGEAL